MRKRNSSYQAKVKTFHVGTGNQAVVPSSDYLSSGSALNIADGQLGVLSADLDGTIKPGAFVSAGTTATKVKAVQIVQGTPYSANTTQVSPFGHTHKASVLSGVIRAGKIKSVSTTKYALPKYQMYYIRSVSGLAVSTRYELNVTLESVRGDVVNGMNREVLSSVVTMPSSAPTSAADYLLQNLALDINKRSRYVQTGSTANFGGSKPIIVFGVKSSGGSGTAIGGITKSTSLNFAKYTVNGSATQATFTSNTTFVNSLHAAIASVAGLSTATIENLGNVTPGSAATIDGLLVVVFHENTLPAFDDVKEVVNRAQVGFGLDAIGTTTAQPTYTQTEVCKPYEGANSGRQVLLNYRDRAGLQVFNMQNHVVRSEYFIRPPEYVLETGNYTVTEIEFYDEMETINSDPQFPKSAVIVLPAAISSDTVDADTGYTIATTATTTVSNLNSILGAWLNSANAAYAPIEVKGDVSTLTSCFV